MPLSIRKWLCFLPTQPAMLLHSSAGEIIDFNRDIQLILSGHCIECHGPDSAARKGELRLDRGDGLADDRGGYRAEEFAQAAKEIEERHQDTKEREQEMKKLEEQYPYVMIMREMESPRKAFVLRRGQYDSPGEEVQAALPQTISSDPERAVTRLELARGLVDGRDGARPGPCSFRAARGRAGWSKLVGIPAGRTLGRGR